MERRKLLLAGATAVAGAMASNALAQNAAASTLPDRFAAALSAHDIKAFADLFADDYVNHQFSAAAPAPAAENPRSRHPSISSPAGSRACPTFRSPSRPR